MMPATPTRGVLLAVCLGVAAAQAQDPTEGAVVTPDPDPSAPGLGCAFDSVCEALTAQGQGDIRSITFQLLNSTRLGGRDSHAQQSFAVVQQYTQDIAHHSSDRANATKVEVDAGDSEAAFRLYNRDVFEVVGADGTFPAHVTFLIGKGGDKAMVKLSTACGAHDLRVGDTFGAIRVVGYGLTGGSGEASSDCQTKTVTIGVANDYDLVAAADPGTDTESEAMVPVIYLIAGAAVMLFMAVIVVTVHRASTRRARLAAHKYGGGGGGGGGGLYTVDDNRLSDVSWNKGFGDVMEVEEPAEDIIHEEMEVEDESEDMVVGRLVSELHRLDQKRELRKSIDLPRLDNQRGDAPARRPLRRTDTPTGGGLSPKRRLASLGPEEPLPPPHHHETQA